MVQISLYVHSTKSKIGCYTNYKYRGVDALTKHALAPLKSRRDIAMLGFLHRVARKWAPSIFNKLVQSNNTTISFPRGLRAPERRHNHQLKDPCEGNASRILNKSNFGLTYTYNLLPQIVIDAPIEIFQKYLQHALKGAVYKCEPNWQGFYREGIRIMTIEKFHFFVQ